MLDKSQDVWDTLVRWLETHEGFECHLLWKDIPGAGRGLVASRDIKPGGQLFRIPSTALLNPLTILASPSNIIPPHLFPQATYSHAAKKRRISHPPGITRNKLNTTQLLVLWLVLQRHRGKRHGDEEGHGAEVWSGDGGGSASGGWDGYLGTLPQEVGWHPLCWAVWGDEGKRESPAGATTAEERVKTGQGNGTKGSRSAKRKKGTKTKGVGGEQTVEQPEREWYIGLLDHIPKTARKKLDEVKDRFRGDEAILRRILLEEQPFKSRNLKNTITLDDLLWAWLIVNTRSVNLPLGLRPLSSPNSELYNHTLVPLLDLINHSSSASICPQPRQIPNTTPSPSSSSTPAPCMSQSSVHLDSESSNSLKRPRPRGVIQTSTPGKIGFHMIAPERGLKEGEEVLFEYGGHCSEVLWAEYGFVEGEDEKGWEGKKWGEVDLGEEVGTLWEVMGPEERELKEGVLRKIGCWGQNTIHSHPKVMPSHGLLMMLRVLHLDVKSDKMEAVRSSLVDYVSPENEKCVRTSLEKICGEVVQEAEGALGILEALKLGTGHVWVVEGVQMMWEERRELCKRLLERMEEGTIFG